MRAVVHHPRKSKAAPRGPYFRQYAKGDFTVNVDGPFHCGPNDGPKTFKYEVELTYPATALDFRGFLLDNVEFRLYFEGISKTSKSCEQLVQEAEAHFRQLSGGRCETCRVAIWGIKDTAMVEYHGGAN